MRRASVLRGYERPISGRQGDHTHLLSFVGFCARGLVHDCVECSARRYQFSGQDSPLIPWQQPGETIWRERGKAA